MRPTNRETSLFFALVIVACGVIARDSQSQPKLTEPTKIVQKPWETLADVQRGVWLRYKDDVVWFQVGAVRSADEVYPQGYVIIDNGHRMTPKQVAEQCVYTRDPYAKVVIEYECKSFVEQGDGL